ncbi:MAG: THUMP domain-containing protein [Acutalibacteraceae bacterium]
MKLNFISPCLLGIESAIASELKDMGATDINAENGRVLFSGDERLIARANIWSRFSERILISLGSFTATSFEELFEGTKKLPWESFIGKNDAFPVKGYCLNSKLFAVSSCQSIIKKAVVERLKDKVQGAVVRGDGPPLSDSVLHYEGQVVTLVYRHKRLRPSQKRVQTGFHTCPH